MSEDNDSSYSVGYGKTPERTRFKKGTSGNPNGRPRKRTTLSDAIDRELRAKVTILEGGINRKITKCEAVAKRVVNGAIGGDTKSAALLLKSMSKAQPDQESNVVDLLQEFQERSRNIEADKLTEKESPARSINSQPVKASEDQGQ